MLWACVFFTLFFGTGFLLPRGDVRALRAVSAVAVPSSILIVAGYFFSKVGIPLSGENFFVIFTIIFSAVFLRRLKTDGHTIVMKRVGVTAVVSLIFVFLFTHLQIFPPGYGVDTARHLALTECIFMTQKFPTQSWEFIHSQYSFYPLGTATLTGVFAQVLEVDPAYSLYPLMLFIAGLTLVNVLWILSNLKASFSVFLLCGFFLIFSKLFFSVSVLSFYAQVLGLYLLTWTVGGLMEKEVLALITMETALVLTYPLYAFLPFFAVYAVKDWRKIAIFQASALLLSLPFILEHIGNPVWLVPTPSIPLSLWWKEGFIIGLAFIMAGYSIKLLYKSENGRILLFFGLIWVLQIPVFFVLDYLKYVELYFLYKQIFVLLIVLPVFLAFSFSDILTKLRSFKTSEPRRRIVAFFSFAVLFSGFFGLAFLNISDEISTMKGIPPPLTEEEYILALNVRALHNIACTNESEEGFSHERHVHLLMLSAVSQTFFDVLSFQQFLESAKTGKYPYLLVERDDYQKYNSWFSGYRVAGRGTYIFLLEKT